MSLESFERNLEQKYVFLERHKHLLKEWLAYVYAPDPKFHTGTISSIYFDTADFRLYGEKANSDYIKSKLRLRWYENIEEGDPERLVASYLEVKRKYGSTRKKDRLRVLVRAGTLRDRMFEDHAILELAERACELGYSNTIGLLPAALIQYDRFRYVAPDTGARVSLDTAIRCLRMNPILLCGTPPVHLSMGVLEVKGALDTLPESLFPVRHLLRKEAFSKYSTCLDRLVSPMGAVA